MKDKDCFFSTLHKAIYEKQLSLFNERKRKEEKFQKLFLGLNQPFCELNLLNPALYKQSTSDIYKIPTFECYSWDDLENLDSDFSSNEFIYEESELMSDNDCSDNESVIRNVKTVANDMLCWFPVYCGGVCRIVGKFNRGRVFVTGAILEYREMGRTVTTLEGRYKLVGGVDITLLKSHAKLSPDIFLDAIDSLSEVSWLREIVRLTMEMDTEFHLVDSCHIRGMSDRQLNLYRISHMKNTSVKRIFKKNQMTKQPKDKEAISNELENILMKCENDGDWYNSLKKLLQQCGQNIHLLESTNKTACCQKQKSKFLPVDLDDSGDSISYIDFSGGEKINSTLINLNAQLALWSFMKGQDNNYYIRGLELNEPHKRLVDTSPLLVSSVSNDYRSVVANKCKFELMGPMYKLAIVTCYPDTENASYLDIFQYHFTKCIPKNWKNLVSIMHIICQCTQLEYQSPCAKSSISKNSILSEQNVHSPSFNPRNSLSIQSLNEQTSLHNTDGPSKIKIPEDKENLSKNPLLIVKKLVLSNVLESREPGAVASDTDSLIMTCITEATDFVDSNMLKSIQFKDINPSKSTGDSSNIKVNVGSDKSRIPSSVVSCAKTSTRHENDPIIKAGMNTSKNHSNSTIRVTRSNVLSHLVSLMEIRPQKKSRKRKSILDDADHIAKISSKRPKTDPKTITDNILASYCSTRNHKERTTNLLKSETAEKTRKKRKSSWDRCSVKSFSKEKDYIVTLQDQYLNIKNVCKTRLGRVSLPPTDPRTGITFEKCNHKVYIRRDSVRIKELREDCCSVEY